MTERPARFRDLRLQPTYQPHEDRLGSFYVPVLQLAIRYDRLVGYWRSSSLVVAAAGLSRFLLNARQHGGRMRIIAGAELLDQDVAAIEAGEPLEEVLVRRLLDQPDEAEDVVTRHRLQVLAWMVRDGLLDIRIGVPLDPKGKPLPPQEADRRFHTKFGVLTDSFGDRIVFEGSVNETAQGWRLNHEAFTVFQSWDAMVWERYGQPWVDTFERHWEEPEHLEGWRILELPEALKERLLERLPPEADWVPPVEDPQESEGSEGDEAAAAAELRRLGDAPLAGGGTGVGFVTLPIEPWPHQESIAARILDTWPRSYLLADEVGLGKTIEVGMAVRELLLTGRAERILLLVPASVLRQWQEELYEKFCLDVPAHFGGRFLDYAGEEVKPADVGSVWSAFPVMLASSHLARMRRHRQAVLESGPWDLVLVDEAHHARRRGIGGAEGANQLLQLLREMRDRGSWQALLLATATPMQMNTHEVYDLLELLGLPGRWAGEGKAPEKPFEEYYSQLAEPDVRARDWPLLRGMLSDYFRQPEVQPNRAVLDQIRRDLPGPTRILIEKFHSLNLAGTDIAGQSLDGRRLLDAWLRANTPMRDRVFRTSRQALREYQRQGILDPSKTIPRRHVEDRFVPLREPDEKDLYDRIESYISRYYEAYNQKKETKPLGFIMTVYRRRLTSSLHAVHCSLERRRKVLQDEASADQLLDEDDRQVLETSVSFDPDQLSGKARQYGEEIAELTSFLHELEAGIPEDSKVAQLTHDIQQAFFDGHQTVVVFTQYTDTLEWLREQLRATYGTQIACYSGHGGSRWNPELGEWERLTKKRVKDLFRQGDEVRILLGTDAMSEGLNLQTCDRLINYDMPWNFMRVEQRIGRIDRIEGQPLVTITNYFYSGTVEEQVYTGIKEDAEWFEQVVGPAQPVLSQVETVIEDLAMRKAGDARDQALSQELAEVRQAITDARKRAVKITDLNDPDPPQRGYGAVPAITLEEIERILTTNTLTRHRMHPHPDFAHTYFVEVGGEKKPATFDRQVYDDNAEIRFMTYGEPVFEGLLDEALRERRSPLG